MKRIVTLMMYLALILNINTIFAATLSTQNECVKTIEQRSFGSSYLLLNNCKISDSDMPLIADYILEHNIQNIYLAYNNISNQGLTVLNRAAGVVKSLNLDGNWQITDTGISYISKKMNLRVLSIKNIYLGVNSAKAIAQMKELYDLSLDNVDDEMAIILGEKYFITLEIGKNDLTDKGFDNLTKYNKHHDLFINKPAVSDATLINFAKKFKGYALGISNGELSNEVIKAISQNTHMKWLHLANVNLNDQGGNMLGTMQQLKGISIPHNHIQNNGIKGIAALPHLYYINANDNNLGKEAAKLLANNKRLQDVYLNDNDIGDEGFKALVANKHIFYLEMANTNITDAALTSLLEARKLWGLNLASNKITDKGIIHFYRAPVSLLDLSYNPIDVTEINNLRKNSDINVIADGIDLTKSNLAKPMLAGTQFSAEVKHFIQMTH